MNNKFTVYSVGIVGIVLFTFLLSVVPDSLNFFREEKSAMFVFTLIVIMIMLYEVKLTKSSSEPTFLRTIPGLKAVEEAVGRSTEMGRPMLYVPVIMDMNEVETEWMTH